ncbi:MAG: ribosome biogenesis GTPase Der, partial [Myxococcota bacterium]
WDLVENTEWKENYEAAIRHDMPFLSYTKMLKVSGKTGRGTQRVFAAVVAAQQERHRRVGTGELNRFFKDVVEHHPPPVRQGRRARLLFCSQPLIRPPTFIFTTNRSASIPGSYKRYLENRLRERYGFDGTPIWIKFREKRNNKKKLGR